MTTEHEVKGYTTAELIEAMSETGIHCSLDKFKRLAIEIQRRALEHTTNEEKETAPREFRCAPEGSGPCAKQTVTATLIAKNGGRYIGTNHCMNPQTVCPRAGMATGQGYELCRSVCKQGAHAEVNAILLAGDAANGASLRLAGHTYACESCKSVAREYGVAGIVIEEAANGDD